MNFDLIQFEPLKSMPELLNTNKNEGGSVKSLEMVPSSFTARWRFKRSLTSAWPRSATADMKKSYLKSLLKS